jgi:hypothetical protein
VIGPGSSSRVDSFTLTLSAPHVTGCGLFTDQRWTWLLFDVATGQTALLQVLLVIVLGWIKGHRGDDLRRNRL